MTQTMFRPNRRAILFGAAAIGVVAATPAAFAANTEAAFANSPWRKITNAEWKKKLSPASYNILREEGTEQPFTSPLLNEHRKGTFVCIACGLPLFKSEWKFDSGTGWPSFFTAIEKNLGHHRDTQLLGEVRDEYHCAQCLGHQGHLFNDGPKPTGLRYCNDGVAIRFVPG
jgi:peptide-methionine (R)-S-oxide reductase